MAAIFGHMDYWRIPGNVVMEKLRKALTEGSANLAIFMSTSCLFVSILSVVGNALVIAAVWKDPLKMLRSSPSNFILLSLALADFLVGLDLAFGGTVFYIRIAMNADSWNFHFQMLLLSHFFQLTVSVFHTLLLTVDRFIALARPLQYKAIVTKRRVAISSVSIWVFCFGYAVMSYILQEHFFVFWFVFVLAILLSSEFTYCLYFITLKHLYKHHKNRFMNENSLSNQVLLCQREVKVFIVILSVIVALHFCFLPWLMSQFVILFCQGCHDNLKLWNVCIHLSTLILSANSALNPLIYAWRFSKFRATFKYFLSKYCFKKVPGRRRTIKITPEERQEYNTKL